MGRDLRIWCVFGLSIVGVSSAGSLLASMDAIPPLLRACWRLQATVLVLVPGFVIQWRGAAGDPCEVPPASSSGLDGGIGWIPGIAFRALGRIH